MKIRNAFATASALALVLQAGVATAQAPRATAPAAAAPAGPPPIAIPGLCGFSNRTVATGSKVGKYVIQRVNTIAQQANAEVVSTQTTLQTDAKAVDAQKATLTADQYAQKDQEIRQRVDALQRLVQVRQREIEMTEDKALQRISQEVEPLLEVARAERNCSVILDSDAVIMIHKDMDLTQSVIQKLDAKITEFPFEREHLDQQAAVQPGAAASLPPAAAVAAPRPAAPARSQPARGSR